MPIMSANSDIFSHRRLYEGYSMLYSNSGVCNLRDTVSPVYHASMMRRNLDPATTLDIVTHDTANGRIVIELKITCTAAHPTGVTTKLLRSITAEHLRRTTQPSNKQLDHFLSANFPTSTWKQGKRNATNKQFLRDVADIYNKALRASLPPTKAIQRWSGASRPTASLWVRKARDLGFIGQPTKPGQAGNNRRPRNHVAADC